MIEIILIVFFLVITGLGFGMLKLLEYYIKTCKVKEQEGDEASIKITGFFKKSIAFFIGLSILFLSLFLLFSIL